MKHQQASSPHSGVQDLINVLLGPFFYGQVSINRAAENLGIVWDEDSDMRYEYSTGYGKGVITGLGTCWLDPSDDTVHNRGDSVCDDSSGGRGTAFTVTLLPHRTCTRTCV